MKASTYYKLIIAGLVILIGLLLFYRPSNKSDGTVSRKDVAELLGMTEREYVHKWYNLSDEERASASLVIDNYKMTKGFVLEEYLYEAGLPINFVNSIYKLDTELGSPGISILIYTLILFVVLVFICLILWAIIAIIRFIVICCSPNTVFRS
jgi:hypothetical protein